MPKALDDLGLEFFSIGAPDVHVLAVYQHVNGVIDDKVGGRIAPLPAWPVRADVDHAIDIDAQAIFDVRHGLNRSWGVADNPIGTRICN